MNRWHKLTIALKENVKPVHYDFARHLVADDFIRELACRLAFATGSYNSDTFENIMEEYVSKAIEEFTDFRNQPIGLGAKGDDS